MLPAYRDGDTVLVDTGAYVELLPLPGDVVLIPSGVRQRVTNIGDEDLVFLCVCTPRFFPECYEALGE